MKKAKLNVISFIQETHSTPQTEKKWKDGWNGHFYFAHGSSNAKGVAILIPKNINYDIEDKITDTEGRFLILKIKIENKVYILCNLYAPTQDLKTEQLNFAKIILNNLIPFENENLIIGGDLNFYLNPLVDKQDTILNRQDNRNYRNEILSIINSFNLTDAWRDLYPDARRYTWHSRGKAARLDYFFISEHLMNDLTSYKIIPGLHSDHSILIVSFHNPSTNRGRGFWKFNCNLLHDTLYVKKIKDILLEYEKKYTNMADKGLTWELCKLEIRSFSVPYCIKKKKERLGFKKSLEKDLEILLLKLDNNPDEDIQNSYNLSKKELEEIEKENTNAIIFRSKVKWIEEVFP